MTDSISRQRLPVPLAYRHADRAQVLAAMIEDLVDNKAPLKTKSPSDPTVALLDAWATVADIVDFYQERIATENYLTTAIEPESVLALASLLGYRPRPGLAASCWLAYTLIPDPTDTAVLLPQHQLVQSVPGAGESPQTFETTEDLVARPRWNTLPVKNTVPLQITAVNPTTKQTTYQTLTQLVLADAVAQLQPNDVLLITPTPPTPPIQGANDCMVVRVDHTSADLIAKTTTVALQQQSASAGHQQVPPAEQQVPPAEHQHQPSPVTQPNGAPPDVVTAIGNLVKPLMVSRSVPPASQTAVARNPANIFPGTAARVGSQLPDVTAKVLAALHPGLAKALYPALASTTIGKPQVGSVQALRTTTAPFGVQIPPRARFDNRGRPLPPEEWPIVGYQTIKIIFSLGSFIEHHGLRMLAAVAPPPHRFSGATARIDALDYHDAVFINDGSPNGEFDVSPGKFTISSNGNGLQFTTTGDATSSLEAITVEFDADPAKHGVGITATRTAADDHSDKVEVTLRSDLSADSQLELVDPTTIAVSSTNGEAALSLNVDILTPLVSDPATNFKWLVVEVVSALPVASKDRKTLYLNGRHDEIVAGSYVMIENGSDPSPANPLVLQLNQPSRQNQDFYPLVTQVQSASAIALNNYGTSATVTCLQLDADWIDGTRRLLSDLRPLVIRTQSMPLNLLPTPRTDPLADNTIEVDGLFPGLEAGRRLVLTGTRADLGDAVVQDGEAVMVSEVTQTSNPAYPGDSPYTTITLAKPLSYTYKRDTVTIYGNVAPAHHGGPTSETLSATGDPAHPMFTLAQSPVLADPSGTAAGFVTSLRLVIDGRIWTQVGRMDDTTPPRCYTTGTDGQGRTTITLSQPLPHPASTATATYRAGIGSAGNVRPGQLTQLLTKPLAVAKVTNPLPASGGSDPDGPDTVRRRAPMGLQALGRVVSIQDAADLALSWAGIGKTTATLGSDGHRGTVTVTVAGTAPTPLDLNGSLITDLGTALTAAGDVTVPITVVPAEISLIVLVAQIRHDPDIVWDDVEPAVRAEIVSGYGYDQRGIDEDIVLSDLVAIIHRVDGVRSCTITQIGLIPHTIDPAELAAFSPAAPPQDGTGRIAVTGVAYLSDSVTETLILQEVQP
jgi:predicted phage baseplate assembly protein